MPNLGNLSQTKTLKSKGGVVTSKDNATLSFYPLFFTYFCITDYIPIRYSKVATTVLVRPTQAS